MRMKRADIASEMSYQTYLYLEQCKFVSRLERNSAAWNARHIGTKGCKLCIFPQKEGSDFSLRITLSFCRLQFSWSAFVPFVIAVRSSHFFLAVTPLFLVAFSRLERIFCVTELINLQAPRFLYIGQAFRYSPENAFYIFNQQIYFIV